MSVRSIDGEPAGDAARIYCLLTGEVGFLLSTEFLTAGEEFWSRHDEDPVYFRATKESMRPSAQLASTVGGWGADGTIPALILRPSFEARWREVLGEYRTFVPRVQGAAGVDLIGVLPSRDVATPDGNFTALQLSDLLQNIRGLVRFDGYGLYLVAHGAGTVEQEMFKEMDITAIPFTLDDLLAELDADGESSPALQWILERPLTDEP